MDSSARKESSAPKKIRTVRTITQSDIMSLRRSQKLIKEEPFARPCGDVNVKRDSCTVVGMFVSNPKPAEVCVTSSSHEPEGSSAAEAPEATERQQQLFVRVQLAGQAEQLLPLSIMRKEHPQLLIDYLLSTAHLV